VQVKCNNDIRNQGLKKQLCLGNKKTHKRYVNEALRETTVLEVAKLAAWFSVRIKKNESQDIVEEPAATKEEEQTAHSLRVRDVGAPTTLGTFTCTDQKKKKWWYPLGYSG
jgi:hypothetical protein